jgi:nucleotide-binding universal stress UspA family protein
MSTSSNTPAAHSILLATDLSAQGDRALDRAVVLAREQGARLIAMHVLEPGMPAAAGGAPSWHRLSDDHREWARYRLGLDLDGAGVDSDIRVEGGDPAEHISRAAQESGCDLVVTGVGRNESLGKLLLGSTVRKLVRQLSVPVLVVKNRPHGAYPNGIVATDFSPESGHALRLAARLMQRTPLTLFHACDTVLGMPGDAAHAPESLQRDLRNEMRRFLEATQGLPAGVPADMVVRYGEPETLLSEYVFRARCDLVVAGAQRMKGIMGAMVGSVAERLLESLPSDVMLVRGQAVP